MSLETHREKVLLIDLENCPSKLEQLPTDLANYLQVLICYATSKSNLPLSWLLPLSDAISAKRLKIIKMDHVSKNAADFGICFLAGSLMQEVPKETHFVIVSNDKDLDHVVHLLKSHGRSAERIGTQKEEKNSSLSPEQIPPTIQRSIADYCNHLITFKANRPAKIETLLNSIKAKFKINSSDSESIYKILLSSGAIKTNGQKIVYNDKKIQELTTS
jgi:hypothetical protein